MARQRFASEPVMSVTTDGVWHTRCYPGAVSRKRYPQIDIMKGLAILGVIFTHAVSQRHLNMLFAPFNVDEAVPVFIILMAFNLALSLKADGGRRTLRAQYSRRLRRLIAPFVTIFIVSSLIATWRWTTLGVKPAIGTMTLLGYLPFGGPGNYFIAVLLGFTALGPLLYRLYRMAPRSAVALMFMVDIAFELLANAHPLVSHPLLYAVSPLRFLGAFAIGLWLSDDWGMRTRRNRWIWAGSILSMAYLLANHFGYYLPFVIPDWQPLNFLEFAYAGALVMAGMRWLPNRESRGAWSVLAALGKASYHIYLVQILFFGFHDRPQLVPLLGDMATPSVLGYLFYLFDKRWLTPLWGPPTPGFARNAAEGEPDQPAIAA